MKLFDLFRRKAPEPTNPIDGNEGIIEALRASGLIPDGATATVHVVRGGMPVAMPEDMLPHRAGIKPPSDALAEGWAWSRWRHEMQINSLAGWAYCRFANRMAMGDRAEFVFGNARGSFGIWQKPFRVCDEIAGGSSTEILTCVTHLESGQGIAIFEKREIAAEACDLAEKICNFSGVDPDDERTWAGLYDRLTSAWAGIGVQVSSDAHCHSDDGRPMKIFGRSEASMMAGRPEKLS